MAAKCNVIFAFQLFDILFENKKKYEDVEDPDISFLKFS